MNNAKVLLIGIVSVAIGIFALNQKKYEPVSFNGEVYTHVETTIVNNVANHFFTPGGIDLPASPKFLQITDYGHPDLTERHINVLRQQLSATMSLKPIKSGSNRFFGMYRNRHPIYAIEKNNVFVIYSIEAGFEGDENSLRSRANKVIDVLEVISTNF